MIPDLLTVGMIGGGAALASLAGGLIALWRRPTTLFMSGALGFASGALLGAIAFKMLPEALELGSIAIAAGGFAAGFCAVYLLDLYVHRGKLAGEESEQRRQVERFYRVRRPRGGEVTVLAAGTSVEEVIEGLSIGVGAAIMPGLALVVALAIAIDNLSEGLSIGEIIRSESADPKSGGSSAAGRSERRRILGWTGVIGGSVFVSTLVGWLLLRGLSEPVLGLLFAAGAGGMFYLTVTDLIPEAEERHYQQSAAISMAVGFIGIFLLSSAL